MALFSRLNEAQKGDSSVAAESEAISAALDAVAIDTEFGLLTLWVGLQQLNHKLVGRTLSFILAQQEGARPELAEIVLLDALRSPQTLCDPSTLLNISTTLNAQLRGEGALTKRIVAELLRPLWAMLAGTPVLRDAALDLLNLLAETRAIDTFPRKFVVDAIARLQTLRPVDPEDQLPTDDINNFVRTASSSGIEASRFYEDAFREFDVLEYTIAARLEKTPGHPLFAAALDLAVRARIDTRAYADSAKMNVPVQTIRVSSRERHPPLTTISPILEYWIAVFKSVCSAISNTEPVIVPLGAAHGSFVINAAVEEAPEAPNAFSKIRELSEAQGDALQEQLSNTQADTSAYRNLLEALSQNRATVEVLMVSASKPWAEPRRQQIEITAASAKASLPPVRTSASKLQTDQIPQADDIGRLFLLVELMADNREVTPEALNVSARQVNYYRQAGRILRLLSEENSITAAGLQIARLNARERRISACVLFEQSDFGAAWIAWSNVSTLADLKPTSANEFILSVAPNLSDVTAARRAQTLSAWQKELAEFHYSRWD
ncbi:MAG TPA: hypothetical protein VIK01_21640 [Polyangiaceae bacterium]